MTTEPESSTRGYEARDVQVRVVVICVALLVVGLAMCFGTAALVDHGTGKLGRPSGPETTFRHGAAEESSITRDWRAQDAAVREHLEDYAWVDRGNGIVRIPVERAMELTVSHPAAEPQKKAP